MQIHISARNYFVKGNSNEKKISVPENYCEEFRNNTMNSIEIAKKLKISSSTVLRYFKSNNITRNYMNKEWLYQKYTIEKLSISEIVCESNSNNKTINNYLKKYNIINSDFSVRSKKYTYNLKFFNKIDNEEKAYWLGFLYADGCLNHYNYRLSFKLQKGDYKHLENFRDLISPENIITFSKNYDERTQKIYYKSNFAINNMTIYNQLIKLGVIPCKKHEYNIPDLPEELIHHFIRGYFDGDGCISINKNSVHIEIVGGEKILNFIAKEFEKIIYKPVCVYKSKDNNMYIIHLGGNIICNSIMNYLYSNAKYNCLLERKFKKWYEYFIKWYEKTIEQNKRYSLIFAEMQRAREKLPSHIDFESI